MIWHLLTLHILMALHREKGNCVGTEAIKGCGLRNKQQLRVGDEGIHNLGNTAGAAQGSPTRSRWCGGALHAPWDPQGLSYGTLLTSKEYPMQLNMPLRRSLTLEQFIQNTPISKWCTQDTPMQWVQLRWMSASHSFWRVCKETDEAVGTQGGAASGSGTKWAKAVPSQNTPTIVQHLEGQCQWSKAPPITDNGPQLPSAGGAQGFKA